MLIVSVTCEMCATGATRSDETSAQSRVSRTSRKPCNKWDMLDDVRPHTSNDTMSNATMLMTLIIGLIAGPAVSL